jgi:thiol-disulfide isomerase/thioredoxin
MKNKKTIIGWVAVVVVVGGLFYSTTLLQKNAATTADLAPFVQCLKDKGALFYGAFWCPHCQNQKKLFGSAADALPYIECSNPDGKSLTQICIDKKIEGFPTWIFADGTRESGELSLEHLAEKTACQLPKEGDTSETTPTESL